MHRHACVCGNGVSTWDECLCSWLGVLVCGLMCFGVGVSARVCVRGMNVYVTVTPNPK